MDSSAVALFLVWFGIVLNGRDRRQHVIMIDQDSAGQCHHLHDHHDIRHTSSYSDVAFLELVDSSHWFVTKALALEDIFLLYTLLFSI